MLCCTGCKWRVEQLIEILTWQLNIGTVNCVLCKLMCIYIVNHFILLQTCLYYALYISQLLTQKQNHTNLDSNPRIEFCWPVRNKSRLERLSIFALQTQIN